MTYLEQYQTRLTLDLTDWLTVRWPLADSSDEARLQCWVNLLVQSLMESLRSNQPALLADFVVVLRAREGHQLFNPQLWRAALGWLNCRCNRLLRRACPVFNSADLSDEATQQWEQMAGWLTQLDRAVRLGQCELAAPVLAWHWLSPVVVPAKFELN